MSTASWVAVGTIALAVKPILSYLLYRSERKAGRSRAEIILERNGGPARLLAKSKQATLLAWMLMLGPLAVFFMQSETLGYRAFLFGISEIFFIPTGILVLWDAKQSRKIVGEYNRDKLGSTSV